MGIAYIKNQCVERSDPGKSGLVSRDREITTDAPSFVLGAAPINETMGFSISRFAENQSIIGLDFVSNNKMWASLGRIAHFVERMKKTQPLALNRCIDGECAKGEGYDFKLSDIAQFYNQTIARNGAISGNEKDLLNALLQKCLLININGSFAASEKSAIVGMSREFDLSKRKIIFTHEYSHALYFVDAGFRNLVSKTWNGLSDNQKNLLKGIMIASGIYSSGEQWLMETEAQAHGIAWPKGEDGFINLLIGAYENCGSSHNNPKGCKQFTSYHGNIRPDLEKIHDIYEKISECRIPLLSAGHFINGSFVGDSVPNRCSGDHTQFTVTENPKITDQTLKSLAKLLHGIGDLKNMPYELNPDTEILSPEKWMKKIQNWIDRIHKNRKQ